jgi:hypothetical protein
MSHPIASNVRSMLHEGKTMIAVLAALPVAYELSPSPARATPPDSSAPATILVTWSLMFMLVFNARPRHPTSDIPARIDFNADSRPSIRCGHEFVGADQVEAITAQPMRKAERDLITRGIAFIHKPLTRLPNSAATGTRRPMIPNARSVTLTRISARAVAPPQGGQAGTVAPR